MSGFQWDMKMSLGNIITIGVLVVSLTGAFVTVQNQVGNMQASIVELQNRQSEKNNRWEAISEAYEKRIRAIEIAQASQSSRLEAIQIGINDIKDQLRRIAEGK